MTKTIERAKSALQVYHSAGKYRKHWFDVTWRIVVIAIAAIGLLFARQHLNENYSFIALSNTGDWFMLSDKLLYWFFAGMLFGLFLAALLFEGELWLGSWKIAKALERREGKKMSRK
jgi:uncharacterized membrane protein YhhN